MLTRRKLIVESSIAASKLIASTASTGLLLTPTAHAAVKTTQNPTSSNRINSANNPVVATTLGPVRGFREAGVNVFRGIRYGENTRLTRFLAPRQPASWLNPIDTFEYGPACPQTRADEPSNEDCLFLNVWSSKLGTKHKRPVMFYIHGGAYANGSGSSALYDGKKLAKDDEVIVVTVNHRLNAFGYLYLQQLDPNYPDSGNTGQLDLILALNWVKNNIAQFGGDPSQVMVFGQSGGGAKIATMMAMPLAKGLFHRVATMSGQQITATGPHNATLRTLAFLDALKLSVNKLNQLQYLSTDELLKGLEARDPILDNSRLYFGPVLDMNSLSQHPFYPRAASQSAHIPMIIGNTHDETRAFLRGEKYTNISWQALPTLLVSNMRVDIRPEFVVAEYRKLYPNDTPTQIFYRATTAARSWRSALIEAEERAKLGRNNTYCYQLDWINEMKPTMGAPHTLDIPLVFGNLGAPRSITGTSNNAQRMSLYIRNAFTQFAHTGNPNYKGLPKWAPYSLKNRETMVFNVPPALENDPRGAERKIFARVPYIQPGS